MNYQGNPVALCFVSNEAYLQHLCVSIASLLKNSAGEHKIFVFTEDITDESLTSLQQMVVNYSSKSKLFRIFVDGSQFDTFKDYWPKLGKQVFQRLLIPDLIPDEFSFVLYLDADIVILRKIELPENILSGVTIAAVKDSISDVLAPKRGMGRYFNAGVMFIDVARWRQLNAFERIMHSKPKKTLFAEQEMLNEVFKDDWVELPKTFNFAANKLTLPQLFRSQRVKTKPIIVHFLGGVKPWIYWVRGSTLYWFYVWQTPFRWRILRAPKTIFTSLIHKTKKTFNINF